MPHGHADEAKWEKAKKAAAKSGQADNYAIITTIYKNMGGKFKPMEKSGSERIADLLIKAGGKKDITKLQKKSIINRKGKQQTVWFRADRAEQTLAERHAAIGSLYEKIRKQGKGQGREIKLTHNEIKAVLRKSNVGVVSAGRNPKDPKDMKLTDKQIDQRHEKLKSDLVDMGYQFVEGEGKYEGLTEKSLIVMMPDASRKDVIELGKKYNQDSVIYSEANTNRMIFTSGADAGKFFEGKGFEEKSPDTSDFYTQIGLAGDKSLKFLMNFNFDVMKKSFARLRDLLQIK